MYSSFFAKTVKVDFDVLESAVRYLIVRQSISVSPDSGNTVSLNSQKQCRERLPCLPEISPEFEPSRGHRIYQSMGNPSNATYYRDLLLKTTRHWTLLSISFPQNEHIHLLVLI
jgi:hypothetical protein